MSKKPAISIKAIVTDLDGTAVKSMQSTISPAVVQAIADAKYGGIQIAAVTGRPFGLALPVLTAMGLDGYNVVDGGATITLGLRGEVVWTSQLEAAMIRRVVLLLLPYSRVIHYDNEVGVIPSSMLLDVNTINNTSAHVWAAVNADKENEVLALLRAIPGIAVHANPGPNGDFTLSGIQVTDIEADKSHGVRRLLEYIQVDAEHTLSVGDGDNDLPLFEASGVKIAMGNATDTLKDASDYVVASVDNDGFAEAIHIALD